MVALRTNSSSGYCAARHVGARSAKSAMLPVVGSYQARGGLVCDDTVEGIVVPWFLVIVICLFFFFLPIDQSMRWGF